LHHFETKELAYLLVCCGADKGQGQARSLIHRHPRTHTGGLMTEAAHCVFLSGP
jgi:hypothetical protein